MFGARVWTAILAALVLAACSTAGRKDEVVGKPDKMQIAGRHAGPVTVAVAGGDERYVTGPVFQEALLQTLNETRIFSAASALPGATYDLKVVILSMSHPFLAYVADMTTLWTLRTADGKEIWSETINASGHSANFGGVARIRASYEGAARASIEAGVSKLSGLQLGRP